MKHVRISRFGWRLATLALLFLVPLAVGAAPPTPGSGEETVSVMAPPVLRSATTVRAPWGLRLREGPSLGDRTVLILRNGETVYPSGGPVWREGISWTYVLVYRYGYRYEGFCASAYLAATAAPPPPPLAGLRVVASSLRLRTGPGLMYRVSRVVPKGAILQPTGATQWGSGLRWTQVSVDGLRLWAASNYLVAN